MEHKCKENLNPESILIVKLQNEDIDPYDSTHWLVEVKEANLSYPIYFCPYCGIDLNRLEQKRKGTKINYFEKHAKPGEILIDPEPVETPKFLPPRYRD